MESTDSNDEPASSSNIFISYRREDSAGYAGRLYDRLIHEFGRERIFMDIDTIEPGEDFIEVIEAAVSRCDVLVAVIAKHWLKAADGEGHRRLDDPADFVRVELAKALERKIKIIPLLVEGAAMPRADELPPPLQNFVRLQACQISSERWRTDVEQLIQSIRKAILKRHSLRSDKKSPARRSDENSTGTRVKRLFLLWPLWAGLGLAAVAIGLIGLSLSTPPVVPAALVAPSQANSAATVGTPSATPTIGATAEPSPASASGNPTPETPDARPSSTPAIVQKETRSKRDPDDRIETPPPTPAPTPSIGDRLKIIVDSPPSGNTAPSPTPTPKATQTPKATPTPGARNSNR